jgi:Arm DNA-binding domain
VKCTLSGTPIPLGLCWRRENAVGLAVESKWVLRFTWRGNAKEMGLGSAGNVTLADAREKAASARRMIAQGLDPIASEPFEEI